MYQWVRLRQTRTGCCSCSNQDLGQSIRSAAFRRSTAFRKLKPDNAVGLPEIHGFCNGGEKAYGGVVFLKWKLANGNYFCVPLMVKAFVASLKEKYLPLELAELYFIYFIFILFDFAPFHKYGAGIPQQHNQLLWSQK